MSQSKGKARATEQTPLLPGPSQSSSSSLPATADTDSSYSYSAIIKLKSFLLTFVALAILFAAFLALLAWSYASQVSKASSDSLINSAMVICGPDALTILNVTDNGSIWLNVSGRVGLDAGAIVNVHDDRQNDGFFTLLWKSFGRWGIRKVDLVSVDIDPFPITSLYSHPPPTLASITTIPMQLPLTDDPPPNLSWLRPMSTSILITPTNNTHDLIEFARHAWSESRASLGVSLPRVSIHGGNLYDTSWRSLFQKSLANIDSAITIQIPPLPGFPHPGKNVPFPDIGNLISLQSFSIYTSGNALSLSAQATIVNPAPMSINIVAPSVPFTISLPSTDPDSSVPLASANTLPFTLTHPNITVQIVGHLLPIVATPSSRQSISTFLGRFLAAKSNDILLSTPLLPAIPPIPAVFPALTPSPNVLRHVTIKNMKMSPVTTPGGDPVFYTSGTVKAHVILPKGFDVNIEVHHVLPDVLVFDGEVPETVEPIDSPPYTDTPAPPAPPLPHPLPERAFGRIRPENWLPSLSWVDSDNDGSEGSAYIVEADLEKIPMEILPGRENDFSKFVQKVIFSSGGAVAGILGNAAVKVQVDGLPVHDDDGKTPDMDLNGLPFRGAVRIGHKRFGFPSIDNYWDEPFELHGQS